MGDCWQNLSPWIGSNFSFPPANGFHSSFPSTFNRRPYSSQNWNDTNQRGTFSIPCSGPALRHSHGSYSFGGGTTPFGAFGGLLGGSYNGRSSRDCQQSNNFAIPASSGEFIRGLYSGESSTSWKSGYPKSGPPRQPSYNGDTWRNQLNDTWRADRSDQDYHTIRTDTNMCSKYNQESYSSLDYCTRTFPRKSDKCNRENSSNAQEWSRYHTVQKNNERLGVSLKSVPRSCSKKFTITEADKVDDNRRKSYSAEFKKNEMKSNTTMIGRCFDEQDEFDKNGRKDMKSASKQLRAARSQRNTGDRSSECSNNLFSKVGEAEDLSKRNDLALEFIHHFKSSNVKSRKKHHNIGDFTSQKQSFKNTVSLPTAKENLSLQRKRGIVFGSQKFVKTPSSADADLPRLNGLVSDFLPDMSAYEVGYKKPLISNSSFLSRDTRTGPVKSCSSFGSFFSGPVNAGPSKMHVKRRTLMLSSLPTPYGASEWLYKHGLFDEPPTKKLYNEPFYTRTPSLQRTMKPCLLDGPLMKQQKVQERPRNGPAINRTASTAAKSTTAVTPFLSAPVNTTETAGKIRNDHTEEIGKILSKSREQQKHRKEGDKPGSRRRDIYDGDVNSHKQRMDVQRPGNFFNYSGLRWRAIREGRYRFVIDLREPMKMVDDLDQNDGVDYYNGSSRFDYHAGEQNCFARFGGKYNRLRRREV